LNGRKGCCAIYLQYFGGSSRMRNGNGAVCLVESWPEALLSHIAVTCGELKARLSILSLPAGGSRDIAQMTGHRHQHGRESFCVTQSAKIASLLHVWTVRGGRGKGSPRTIGRSRNTLSRLVCEIAE
jgi:hypothetical protein